LLREKPGCSRRRYKKNSWGGGLIDGCTKSIRAQDGGSPPEGGLPRSCRSGLGNPHGAPDSHRHAIALRIRVLKRREPWAEDFRLLCHCPPSPRRCRNAGISRDPCVTATIPRGGAPRGESPQSRRLTRTAAAMASNRSAHAPSRVSPPGHQMHQTVWLSSDRPPRYCPARCIPRSYPGPTPRHDLGHRPTSGAPRTSA
jgi:hypothetical protein